MNIDYDPDCGTGIALYGGDLESLSLFDNNSRDSGFEEIQLGSLEDDDGFLEEFAEINFTETSNLPTDFAALIQKPIILNVTISQNPPVHRRAISLEEPVNPLKKKICEKNEEQQDFSIKRKKLVRRAKTNEEEASNSGNNFRFSTLENIKSAIQRSYSEPDLIADFSKSYSLPLTTSRHQDLRAISSDTLRKLIKGDFKGLVENFTIVDCRYPYEYQGGHIEGAINIYTHEQCYSLLENFNTTKKPNILIFHCEFSAERGPNLYRYLRQEDRKRNVQSYPLLCFPEIYILEGGYKKFFQENHVLCHPANYTQMLDPTHKNDLILFRQSSKTWDSDVKQPSKNNISRNVRKFIL